MTCSMTQTCLTWRHWAAMTPPSLSWTQVQSTFAGIYIFEHVYPENETFIFWTRFHAQIQKQWMVL